MSTPVDSYTYIINPYFRKYGFGFESGKYWDGFCTKNSLQDDTPITKYDIETFYLEKCDWYCVGSMLRVGGKIRIGTNGLFQIKNIEKDERGTKVIVTIV